MRTTNDGGPAFPLEEHFNDGTPRVANEGMSLRDYFAAKAMQALIAVTQENYTVYAADVAGEAYAYADAMLKAREA